MSPVLPFDITALIIDIVEENNDTDLLKELALVSHSFHQICSKHLFATVDLHDVDWGFNASSKKGFVKLIKIRPNVVNYIRKLTYKVNDITDDDHLLSPILSNFLPTTSRLNCLAINALHWDWNTLDSSLTSAFLHLMHLPTINHIRLSDIKNFPFSSFTRSVNLHRLDIHKLECFDQPEIVVESGMMPKIREFHTSLSTLSTTQLLHAKTQDGRPAFNFMELRRLSVSFASLEDEQNIRYLLQNAKLLEKLHLSDARTFVGLYDILSPIARTLKVLSLTAFTYDSLPLPLAGLCEGLEAIAGHYMLEALFIEFLVGVHDTEDFIGSNMQKVERVLVKPEWSALTSPLRQISFKVTGFLISAKIFEALQSLPNKYLNHLSKLESVSFNYSVLDLASVEYCEPFF